MVGSTRYVDFDTTKAVFPTASDKCHVSHVVADTGSWEQKMAQVLEEMPEVVRYVKNQGLGFTIPYSLNGEEKQYDPDFIAQLSSAGRRVGPSGPADRDVLNLIVEVSGEARKDKAAKVTSAGFVEVTDPWDAQRTIREAGASARAGAWRLQNMRLMV